MHKVTHLSLKALRTTLPFSRKQLILSDSNSSLNNYSTFLKKGNYPAALTNNNKTMKNLFAVKYYSTSLLDKNTTPTLDPTLFENWTKEEVCSLLCTDEEKGGAGLIVEKVKPLYDAGFNGSSLTNIVSFINIFGLEKALTHTSNDYPSVPKPIITTVVFWFDNLLKTRLYHLWSVEQVKAQLCKPVPEGAGLKIDQFGSQTLHSQEIIELVGDFLEFVEWKRRLLLEPMKIDINMFIGGKSIQDYAGCIPYINNKNNAFRVGKVLLDNVEIKEKREDNRNLKLLNNFAFFGFGKTRFGIQFLDIWKKYLAEKPDEKEALIKRYGQNVFNRVFNAKLIYINLISFDFNESTLKYLRNIVPHDNSTYFVVIDEYAAFCSKDKNSPLQVMYNVLINTIFPIQTLANVVGVYVCGKGAFIDVFGKSILSQIQGFKGSPSLCHRTELQTLTTRDLRNVFAMYPEAQQVLIEGGIYESALAEIMAETAGIPLLVDVLMKRILLSTPKTMDEVLLCCTEFELDISPVILYPFDETAKESFSYQIYSFLMFISHMMPRLDSNKKFDAKIFQLEKIEDLKILPSVDISTLAVLLNCYIESNESGTRLVFPRKTIQRYMKYTPYFSIKPFVEMIPQMLDKGAIFEVLMGSFIIWNTKCGFTQNLTFSKVFPFLVDTKLENILCIDLNSNEIPTKLVKKETKVVNGENATYFWKDIHSNYYLYQNKLNFMKEISFGPEKFVIFEQDLWWLIQDKQKFDFTELAAEINNLSVFPETVHIIFTIFYTCPYRLNNRYYGQSIINRPKVDGKGKTSDTNEIQVPKNVTVVIVDENGVKDIIGEENFVALSELANTQPHATRVQ